MFRNDNLQQIDSPSRFHVFTVSSEVLSCQRNCHQVKYTITRKELIWQSAPSGLCLLSTFLQSWMMVRLYKSVFESFHQSNYVGIIKVIKYHSVDNICSAMSSCERCDPSFIITCSCYDYLVCPTLLHIRHLLELHRIEVSMHRYWTLSNIVCQCLS